MSIDRIREMLDEHETLYSRYMDEDNYALASAVYEWIMVLRHNLTAAVMAADPYTTEADVAFYEGF